VLSVAIGKPGGLEVVLAIIFMSLDQKSNLTMI